MAELVSTGQITITDSNDARPITAYLFTADGQQQIFTRDESSITFSPSWYTLNSNTGLQVSAKVYVGAISGSTDITTSLTNRRFCLTQGGTALTNATTSSLFVDDSYNAVSTPFTVVNDTNNSYLRIKGNLKETAGTFVVFFEGDYTDTASGLTNHIITQITLSTLKTGTNAVYINVRGNTSIEESDSSTKNVVALCADLIRTSGVDTTGLTYKWYESNASTQISTSTASYSAKYGMKTTAAGTSPSASTSDLGVNVPTSGNGNAYNTLVVSETAVDNIGVFRVDITDAVAMTYSAYFSIYDVSDPYSVLISSTSGDKLQNGQGSTTLSPLVYNGSTQVSSLTGWSFDWYFYDKDGKRGAFIDTAKISTAGGAPITANGTGSSATISYSGTSYNFTAGSVIKAVKPNGTAYFYEVASSTTNQVTIRTPSTNTWLNFTNYPYPTSSSDFVGGKLFGCTTQGIRTTSGGAGITLTGDEVDVKSRVVVEANRP